MQDTPSRPASGPDTGGSGTSYTTASSAGDAPQSSPFTPPSINLPKGGGAIRGMDEKFAANPVTGTGSISVPITVSPGRSGFNPDLSLSYDSGAGNGPFGFGWSLSLPAVTRKTDKGLPRYLDAQESDVFILSGAEDLVPVLDDGAAWIHVRNVGDNTYRIHRYRPRIEGLFARIERWTNVAEPGDVHWRSISGDNQLTIYGKDEESRIFDPQDAGRIFSWLICETRDDRGNAILYEYKPEDGVGIDLSQAHERHRGERDDPRRAVNRYLKRVRYGNRVPLLDDNGRRPPILTDAERDGAGWMFELVFDYGEHDANAPTAQAGGAWHRRDDPFSSYRAGFEVRTYRLCQRVLMFHHFEQEPRVGLDCLVRSTDFEYSHEQNPDSARNPVYSFLLSVTHCGYRRDGDGYLKRTLPALDFEYSERVVQAAVQKIDPESLQNLPVGLDGVTYRWTDLHGEGIPGILAEQGGAWRYKRNLSPTSMKSEPGARVEAKFAPAELVSVQPNLALGGGQAQFMDLAGDGQPDLVVFDGPTPGLYEHDGDEGWQPFRPFSDRLNRNMSDPNLRFVDLDGDGHADVLISEDEAFIWHASLAESGFGPAQRVAQFLDEERGPRLVFADGEQSVYLADLSGDGLTDLARIRNGEVCYWPNLGYGRFGAKVTMDRAPWFDNPDQFEQQRVRLADIDGSGTADIIYLHRDGVRLYFNQSGNSWSPADPLPVSPRVDSVASIVPIDLLGNGTVCLVWSSPLPGDAGRQMRYVDLMGGQKPHLLVRIADNLGAETVVRYAPSTRFYLEDRLAGRPWISRLPFPVQVVERVETYDHISRNRFVTRYAYHHGYFDGEEREFRGFGMVEQWDTEELAVLAGDDNFPEAHNVDAASHVPPVHTKTWFHTGVFRDREHVSRQFEEAYYREPGLDDDEFRAQLLPDTTLPPGLTRQEEREACRALKGSMLRQEVYALDGTPQAAHPYTVTEQSFTIRALQLREGNRHAVFFVHARAALSYHYERNPADPRVSHALTLEVDDFGNVLKEATVAYGRRQPDAALPLQADRDRQAQTLVTYTENGFTNTVTADDDYRTPLPCETRTYELTGYAPSGSGGRFRSTDFVEVTDDGLAHRFDDEIPYEEAPTNGRQRRLIEALRIHYRPDDLGDGENDPLALLPLGTMQAMGLSGESYRLAFTPGLLANVFRRDDQPLLPDPAAVLGGAGADHGGYVDLDGDDRWWIPSGRLFFSPNGDDTAGQELAYARQHFFLPHRYHDPFHTDAASTESAITYDPYDLLPQETRNAVGNRITAGERDGDGNLTIRGNNYRVLQPARLMDPNRNRTQVAFDALGMVVGTAVMGKPEENLGDSLDGFVADLDEAVVLAHLNDPLDDPQAILGHASTRLVYDLFAYQRTKDTDDPQPAAVYTLARETHDADLQPGEQTTVQHNFSYSDGFGREIQKKMQAEPERLDAGPGPPRWVGSGWTIFNNKGKPVRQYEPFFSNTHQFEFGAEAGVAPTLFYDPLQRVVATLHPNDSYEKVVFDAWQQTTWDGNDTVLSDPRTDLDIRGITAGYFAGVAGDWQTWHAQRQGGVLGAAEEAAAAKAADHADTPTTAYLDALSRPFLTLARNRFVRDGAVVEEAYATRVELDIEGNQRAVRDAVEQNGDEQGRVVMRYDYDMLGNRIHQASMEAGERWSLSDVAGEPIRTWDSRGHTLRSRYDLLRRPVETFLRENVGPELLVERTVYGESRANPESDNLRGQVVQRFDEAGVVASDLYDFKGNLLRGSRQFAQSVANTLDWSGAVPLEADIYTNLSTYDALNRPVTVTTPHTPAMAPNLIHYAYNEANLLERVDVSVRGAAVTPFVTNIDYNARGQRVQIVYQNGATTGYTYDPLTFRLVGLTTTRPAGLNGPSAQIFSDAAQIQDLHYIYDPVGNVTQVEDAALPTIFHNGEQVEPQCDYIYDAVYRLIEATGREHVGQTAFDFDPPEGNQRDHPFAGLGAHPNDLQALRNYTERYEYDAAGNFTALRHIANGGGWTRSYDYEEDSLTEPGKQSNRLSRTRLGNGLNRDEPYAYDAHGNMRRMPHLGGDHPEPNLQWDYRDRLRHVDLGGGSTVTYVYDAAGQRVRKEWQKSANRSEERLYLGGFEIFRRRNGAGDVVLQRETLHVMDDEQRIALVETRTLDVAGDDPAPQQLTRYQVANHLGSACLELDGDGQLISYEEYHPYGSTAYQARRNQTETPKRYRYTGKERDEESGLCYHGARYYAPWLGRWISSDPIGIADDQNLYVYVSANPNIYSDPTGYGKGKAIGWVVKRVGSKLVKTRAVFTQKEAAKLFAKGYDVLLRGAKRQHLNRAARMVIEKKNILNHAGHALDKELFKKAGYDMAKYLRRGGKRGLPHVQDRRIAGRHIFGGAMAAILYAGTAEASTIENDAVDFTDVYTNPYPGKSIAHGLTVTHWVGEDSALSYLDWINPGELIALGGDLGRAIDREAGKEYVGLSVTIKKDDEPLATYSFDKEGQLLSVARWKEGQIESVIGGEEFLSGLDDPEKLKQFVQEMEQVVIKDKPPSETSDPSERYIRSPDGMILDKETGRTWLGPGPKI